LVKLLLACLSVFFAALKFALRRATAFDGDGLFFFVFEREDLDERDELDELDELEVTLEIVEPVLLSDISSI